MNFTAQCLNPSISSSKPGTDGYEVNNLVSDDASVRQRGFMGAYFIRPPVDISVEFLVPIDISHIRLVARLGQKCSTGFSIFTRPEDIAPNQQQPTHHSTAPSSQGPSTSHHLSSSVNGFSEDLPNASNLPANVSNRDILIMSKEKNVNEVYFCVGKFYIKMEDELLLRNPYYKHWMKLPMPSLGSSTKVPHIFRGTIRHPNRKALRCVKNLIIRIQNTSERGPPVLQTLEVWGQPGISTNKTKRKELLQQWSTYKPLQKLMPDIPRLYNSEPEKSKIKEPVAMSLNVEDVLDVPEDFLDPLTCDVMTVPLLLPSGHSIDAHTLERFVANENKWGRPPSDPFTGVPFKGSKQPTPNAPLKARIDRFLLINGDHPDVERCARTVGSAHNSSPNNTTQTSQEIFSSGASCKRLLDGNLKEDNLTNQICSRRLISQKTTNMSSLTSGKSSIIENSNAEIDISDNDSDTLTKEIEAALGGKPKYLPTQIYATKQNNEKSFVTRGFSLRNQQPGGKVNAQAVRAQTVKNKRDLVTRPAQQLVKPGNSASSSRHGLVQMIGGVLSVAQGRTAREKRLPVHHTHEKPSYVTSGDGPPRDYKLPFTHTASCSCGETGILYKLPCDHLLCRKCIVEKQSSGTEVECGTCRRRSKKSNVVKYHEKSIFSS